MSQTDEHPKPLSPHFIMQKFRLDFKTCREICELALGPKTKLEWIPVTNTEFKPNHMEEFLIFGRPLISGSEELTHYQAYFNANCGWIKHGTLDLFLYATHYMRLPCDPIDEKTNAENSLEKRSRLPVGENERTFQNISNELQDHFKKVKRKFK